MLENIGFRVVDEQTYHVALAGADAPDFWDDVHDPASQRRASSSVDALKSKLGAGLLMVMRGSAENDGYNALILTAGLGWRDVVLIRALSRYLREIRVPFSQDYMWSTLVKHPVIAECLVALFHTRFALDPKEPASNAPSRKPAIAADIEARLQQVQKSR